MALLLARDLLCVGVLPGIWGFCSANIKAPAVGIKTGRILHLRRNKEARWKKEIAITEMFVILSSLHFFLSLGRQSSTFSLICQVRVHTVHLSYFSHSRQMLRDCNRKLTLFIFVPLFILFFLNSASSGEIFVALIKIAATFSLESGKKSEIEVTFAS